MCDPIVKVKQGTVKGIVAANVDGGEYLAFPSIPYAEPPIGDLRFKDPRPLQTWSGVRDVGKLPSKATQYEKISESITGSEDCLYLSVATNSLIGKRPVMVWIHGGGFVLGSAQNDFHGPDYLLKHDIVFVSVAYRLGCLGFLNLNLPDAGGNQGLKDQVAALKWVKENIQAFGGDPENVTIFGESAGGASVHLLTLSPLAQGLFHKAIIQSGSATSGWAFQADPVKRGLEIAEILNKKTNNPKEALEHLMTVTPKQIIEGQTIMGEDAFELNFIFVPSVDSQSRESFLPEHPRQMLKRGVNVPLLIGFVSDEGIITLFGPQENSFRKINENFAGCLVCDLHTNEVDRVANIAESVKNFYFDERPITFEKDKNQVAQLKGDVHFVNGIQEIVDCQVEKITPTYLYRFSYRPSYPTLRSIAKCPVEGTCHADEVNSILHSQLFMPNKPHQKGTMDRVIMERMTRMWSDFAKTGNPTPKIDEIITCKWEPITKKKINHLEINNELKPGENPGETSWRFWKPILEYIFPSRV